MKTKLLYALAVLFLATTAHGQEVAFQPLYPNGAQESNGLDPQKTERGEGYVSLAAEADFALFLPSADVATGQAVVICPGGSYHGVAFDHEGVKVARWLNSKGVAAVVLRYRMPNGNYKIPLIDVHTAIKMVRENAPKWNINPAKVGIMGFSAGGHLASTAAVRFDHTSRPDFAILVYPVISMNERYTHLGSRQNLIGREANMSLVDAYSNELQVSSSTPPTFILYSDDDDVVNPINGTLFYNALKTAGVAGELHIYPSGGHGWGWNEGFKYYQEMTNSLGRWLKERE